MASALPSSWESRAWAQVDPNQASISGSLEILYKASYYEPLKKWVLVGQDKTMRPETADCSQAVRLRLSGAGRRMV